MRVTAKLDGQEKPKTLADLNNGVAAKVRLGEATMIRYCWGCAIYGPLDGYRGPIIEMGSGGTASAYEVLEVLGEFSVEFTED